MEIKEDIGVKEYFTEIVPHMFKDIVGQSYVSGMEGTTFTVQFDIQGESLQTYSLVVKDAKDLDVVEGAVENPMIRVELSEDVWRKAATGKLEGAMETFTDMSQMANRSRYDKLVGTKGTMSLELDTGEASPVKINVIFNGADSPRTVFKASLEDWGKIARGEMAGPTAYMSGKLKIEGDMMFAMSLGNLMA